MEHIKDIDIIEYAAGNLDHSRSTAVDRHLLVCSACAKKCAEMSELLDLTANWNPDVPVGDITQNVLQKVSNGQIADRKSTVFTFRKKHLFPVMRVAAMLIFAAGIGHILGLRSAGHYSSVSESRPSAPVYLAALGLQWSNDLTWSVLSDDQTAEYGERP